MTSQKSLLLAHSYTGEKPGTQNSVVVVHQLDLRGHTSRLSPDSGVLDLSRPYTGEKRLIVDSVSADPQSWFSSHVGMEATGIDQMETQAYECQLSPTTGLLSVWPGT